jgi:branched-chain amino acid transport system permease protein
VTRLGLTPAAGCGLAVVLLLGLAPLVAGSYAVYTLFTLLLYMLLAQAWNLLAGYTGLLSLGNQAFIGFGAYTLTLVLLRLRWPLPAAFAAAGAVAMVFGVLAYLPLFRLRGGYFAISTLLVALGLQVLAVNLRFVGQNSGLNVPPAALPTLTQQYLYAWACVVGFLALQWFLLRSPLGLYFQAVRDDQEAAETVGVNPLLIKVVAVAISAFVSGLGGGLLAMQLVSIQPESAISLTLMLNLVVMAIVGGTGTIMGPPLGALLIVVLQQLLQHYVTVYVFLTAGLLILVVQVAPSGLMGVPEAVRRLRARRRRA